MQVPYLAKEFADADALGEDLGLGGLGASSAFSARSRQVASRSSPISGRLADAGDAVAALLDHIDR
ncbi:hypothetical protein [Kitasatospora camelliae]|uniref:Excreted virulence factor EspC (Type VII ESX diderm) n=1 Tax=Kitasatospora camelliae TaxID=3156397 RepID=A0AAU8JP37_9ACTN